MDAPRHSWLATKRGPIGLAAVAGIAVALLAIIVYRAGRSGPNDSVSTSPDVQVIKTEAWRGGRRLLLRLAAPGSNTLLVKSITEQDYQAVASESFLEVTSLTSPSTRVLRYDPNYGSLAPATEEEWLAATGRVSMCAEIGSHTPEGMRLKLDDGRRVELHGRRVELAAKTYVHHYMTDDGSLFAVTSTTGQSSGTYFGSGANVFSGTGYLEVFRQRDGARVMRAIQLPTPVPTFGCWECTHKYFVIQYPDGVVVIPITPVSEQGP